MSEKLPQGPTGLVNALLGEFVRAWDRVLDATAGNGHDTLHLAQLVGEKGQVWAMDLQAKAIESTKQRLSEAGLLDRVELREGNHAQLDEFIPAELHGRLRAIVFNLGYLPGGDRELITRAESTLLALATALKWLAPGGLLAITVYPGHVGGDEEAAAVDAWVAGLERRNWTAWSARIGNAGANAPRTHLIERVNRGEIGA